MLAELKFALNIFAQTKPVNISQSSQISSRSSAEEFVPAIATERSIGGSFLQLDILDKLDVNSRNYRTNHFDG